MPPEFKPRRVTITPTPLGDGSRVAYPVPTSPVGERFARAVCVAPAHDPMALESCSLIIERSMVTKFATFLARHGGIEREPTEQEVTALMQSVADFLAHMQMEAMALVSEALSRALGDPNAEPEAVHETITTSMAEEIAIPAQPPMPSHAAGTWMNRMRTVSPISRSGGTMNSPHRVAPSDSTSPPQNRNGISHFARARNRVGLA